MTRGCRRANPQTGQPLQDTVVFGDRGVLRAGLRGQVHEKNTTASVEEDRFRVLEGERRLYSN